MLKVFTGGPENMEAAAIDAMAQALAVDDDVELLFNITPDKAEDPLLHIHHKLRIALTKDGFPAYQSFLSPIDSCPFADNLIGVWVKLRHIHLPPPSPPDKS